MEARPVAVCGYGVCFSPHEGGVFIEFIPLFAACTGDVTVAPRARSRAAVGATFNPTTGTAEGRTSTTATVAAHRDARVVRENRKSVDNDGAQLPFPALPSLRHLWRGAAPAERTRSNGIPGGRALRDGGARRLLAAGARVRSVCTGCNVCSGPGAMEGGEIDMARHRRGLVR